LTVAFRQQYTADGTPDGIHGTLEYALDLFDPPTITALADRLTLLLRQAARDPGRRAGELEVLTARERHQLLTEWNDPARPVPELTVPALIEARAAAAPQATAVVCGGAELTYAELNARANRLARYLVSLGAGPERLVAVALPRSLDMVVAVLAVLKS